MLETRIGRGATSCTRIGLTSRGVADVFFLRDTIMRGMEPEAVAGFLGRPEREVIAKAKALRIPITEQRRARVGSTS